jgi:plasmid replication initiation protein
MENKLIKQHNALTTARYEMSSLEKNIVYMLLSQLKEDDPHGRKYEIPIRLLRAQKGARVRREELLLAAKKLVSRGITIYQEELKEFITIGVLTSADYGVDDKNSYLVLEFDQAMYPFLYNFKQKFTTYRLASALQLRSKYAKRMYEMLSQFKDTGFMKISLQELKTRLELIDPKSKKEHYSEFGLFRKYVLDIAQREIAEHTELRFTYTAKKVGKKYAELEFKITNTSLQGPKKLNTLAQIPATSTTSKGEAFPHQDLEGDALKQYLLLTKELRWLDKRLAYKVVNTLSTKRLWDHIGRLKTKISAGKAINPAVFFAELLNNPFKKPVLNLPKKEDRQEIIADPEATIRRRCFGKLVTEFGVDVFIVQQLDLKLDTHAFKSLVDDIEKEAQAKALQGEALAHYATIRLKDALNTSSLQE